MDSLTSHTFSSPEVRVVEASAGSGKTYALAKRYVQLVLNPSVRQDMIPIRSILALTFTNKAAFEMKARILMFLKKIALKDLDKNDFHNILGPLGLSEQKASEEAFRIMDYIIRHYNFFQVQTIDKFINALLSGCAFKIGLTSNFRIKTNAHEYLLYSIDQMIDEALYNEATRGILESFLHQYLYIENRSGWFPKEDILAIICALFAQHNTYGKNFLQSETGIDALIKKKKFILERMQELKEIVPEGIDARFRKALDSFVANHPQGFDIDTLSDFFAREDIPLRKGTQAPQETHRLWAHLNALLKNICEEEAFSLFNPYIKIFEHIKKSFTAFSAKDDVLFLEELNSKAALLFDEERITVEELYYRLATRFRHYLVDEFQDTSKLQWGNMEKMIEEGLATGGSLFYVGDKKQAIYGFRGGESKMFDAIKKRFAMFNVKTDILSNNWRSQKAVVDFNNEVFSWDNLNRFILAKEDYEAAKKKKHPVIFGAEDKQEIESVFKESRQTYSPANGQGYVRMEYVDAENKQARDILVEEKLIALIEELKGRFQYRDMAILTRGNKEVELITNWLLARGIPVESERTSNIKENNVIAEILSFLRFLNSPIDNIAFAQFILGDVFARAAGKENREFHQFIFGLRDQLRHEKDVYIYTEFRKAYPALWDELIDPFFRNVGLYPLYELVVSIYKQFQVLGHFMECQGFLMHLLELIRLQEEESSDIFMFLEYFDNLMGEKLYIDVTDTDAVKLLTIHKSKGLEFPVVILPFLGMDIQVGSSNANYQQSYILKEQEHDVSLLRLKSKYYAFSEPLYALYREEYKKSFISELNNIYVAMTRPRYELYGFIPKKIGKAFNFVPFLIPEQNRVLGQPVSYALTETKNDSVYALPPSPCRDWIEYLSEEFDAGAREGQREQRLRGELMHFMLSCVGNLQDQDSGAVLKDIEEQARARYLLGEGLQDCLQTVSLLLQEESLKPFFYVSNAVIYNEKEIVTPWGDTKRIDRLIIKEQAAVIIDYKSSQGPAERDHAQMQAYKDLVKRLYPQKEVQGFLIYLDSLQAEEIL